MRPVGRSGLTGSVGRAAIAYAATVFAAGFVMGTARVLVVSPRLGELAAVLLEAPVMLLVSWLACGVSLRRFGVRGRWAGLAVGASAFGLLMAAELAVSVLVFGRTPAGVLQAYAAPAGAVGMASQIAFGLFPWLRAGRLSDP